MSQMPRPQDRKAPVALRREPFAVIDIGTTSIRMAIAELSQNGEVRMLETLSQAVNLGRDTFTQGRIQRNTIEACVRVLRSYRRILDSYNVRVKDQVRVVATSAVREAGNQLVFIDRIYSATGLNVEPIDGSEVIRLTYLAVQSDLEQRPDLAGSDLVVLEVGGGNSELLLIRDGEVAFSHSYLLGSLRLREILEAYRAPADQSTSIMCTRIDRMVDQVCQQMPKGEGRDLIAHGGDIRFAAAQLTPSWEADQLATLSVEELERFTDRMLETPVDELVTRYHLEFDAAQTLGPALLAYGRLARALGLERILVSPFNLRDGLLRQMAVRDSWSDAFAEQIVRAAIDIGRRYEFDEPHARHTAALCSTLFRALQSDHQLDPHDGMLLHIAALLHEVGQFVSSGDYHKHSMYLITHSELFGLNQSDLELVGLIARYHRKSLPKAKHRGYSRLDRDRRIAVSKLSALLRIADALDGSRSQRVCEIKCERDDGSLVIRAKGVQDLSLEQMSLRQKGELFEDVFGLRVTLQQEVG